jgi:hypothetical protein
MFRTITLMALSGRRPHHRFGGATDPGVGPTVHPIEGSRFFTFAVQPSGTVSNGGDHIYIYQSGTAGLTNNGLILSGRFQTTDLDAGEARRLRQVVLFQDVVCGG